MHACESIESSGKQAKQVESPCTSTKDISAVARCNFTIELWNLGGTCIANHAHHISNAHVQKLSHGLDAKPQCFEHADITHLAQINGHPGLGVAQECEALRADHPDFKEDKAVQRHYQQQLSACKTLALTY